MKLEILREYYDDDTHTMEYETYILKGKVITITDKGSIISVDYDGKVQSMSKSEIFNIELKVGSE